MWAHFAKRASQRKFKLPSHSPSSTATRFSQQSSYFLEKITPPQTQTHGNPRCPVSGFAQVGIFTSINKLGGINFSFSEDLFGLPSSLKLSRGQTSVAEEAVESTDTEEDYSGTSNEVHDLLEQMMKEEEEKGKRKPLLLEQQKNVTTTSYKDKVLRRRQIKMETQAWEEAAREYGELLEDMCELKLVPNLPYMKSLFLGWFEPLRSAIVAEQEVCKESKQRMTHAPYFNDLPAEMMAVITMHKLTGLLMTNSNGVGTARVIQAALQVGEAVENEARIYRYMRMTKKKKKGTTTEEPDGEFDHATIENGKLTEEKEKMIKENNKIRKKVSSLTKKQKMQQAMGVIRELDDWKPWGREAQAKVGCRLMQLLIETAYIQPPVNQLGGGPPDIRPAFKHTFKTAATDSQKENRRYGVIECDPLVQKGLEKTARHMVIPYMPMLVPPNNWTGYDKGAYLFLPSYVMRIHGAKQQREAVKRAPKNQLDPVFEALNTLGTTKWRINKRVLNVINHIWANGGRLADLVDCEDVPLPEEPDTEDEGEIRKWKWKVKAVKKENNERHSQRCDIELKLAVAQKMKDEKGFYYPHNLDFRGRAYPMHPYLNHLGSDLCRGILEFAEGRPLGKAGLHWLKIHLANLFAGGVDKLCYEGRVAFTENHLDDVFDSADRPLEGRRWWLEAEDPFQCLAACINLSKALRSPTPETTISHVPVHQDGSCNGLQHYAALGRDKIYLMDLHIWYTIMSAIVGGVIGARARLGEIRSIEMVHKRFESFPGAFVKKLVSPQAKRMPFSGQSTQDSQDMNKAYAAMFAPFWNEIIKSLREEDFISNREMDLLSIPSNAGNLRLVQWPLFLLSSKILLAVDLALDCKDTQADLWSRICRDEYMAYAVQECYYSIEKILYALVDNEGRLWVERIFREINNSILEGSLVITLSLKKLPLVLSRLTALTGLLIRNDPALKKGAAKAVHDLYDIVTHDLVSSDLRENLDTWNILARARAEGRLFSNIQWPNDPEIKELVKRLHLLLTVKDSAANVPKNLEARRRLEFFSNSLFMDMPSAKPVSEMLPFSVFTPYYSETVLYSTSELQKENEDGISILFYLQKIFPDEWDNLLERIGRGVSTEDVDLQESSSDSLELRFWASYRGQTLARTVRGMMYYRRALMLQSYLENRSVGVDNYSQNNFITSQGFESSRESRAQADLKFTYVVSCQIYGQQKQRKAPEAADIALLLQRNEGLRVAFIHVDESTTDASTPRVFYSKLVKADINGKDQEIYSIKLPGDPKLGEGKPENQNHAIIFTRGDAVQTIDMNQDNYLEEAMKMRNLLEEFHADHGLRPPSILGVREHVFTGSVSSLAWFMSNQETSFVTLAQRVLAYPLKVRMHYGHPDVFDRIFHITRGGISKASRVINISEDIYSGFNSTLRLGNVTHHEYIQVGKGRDVGLNQIALFEGKVAGGNGEQVLSRDIYRLGQLFDFFRMLSFFFTTVGYYVCTMMTVLTVYIFLYGRVYLAFSGLDEAVSEEARLEGNTALDAALNAQFLVQIGVFTAVPMIMGFILELGLLKAVFSFVTMQLQLCSVFFTFSLGTKTHYFGRTILHGGAKYRATGRGFVVRHIKFAENYRLYSRSHFVKALEVALLLIVYIAYGYARGGALTYVLLTLSSWFLVISWLFAPYIFNPSGFEWQKTVEDFDDWTSWLLYKGGVGVKGDNSWESWWDEEQMHIQTLRGRILETILSARFFLFQYGVVYKLHLTGDDTSLAIYGFSWVVLVGIVLVFKIFTYSPKKSADFQLVLRFSQGVAAIGLVAAVCLVVAFTQLSIADLFASILAFIPTGWGILSLAITWRRIVWSLGLWDSVREFARMYDAGMGMIIFAPIAFLSWFPFISTFQSRLLFNQAFSRGLEISLILAGNKANVES